MSNVILQKDNIDNISKLWLPDPKLCTAQEELRRIEEWKRSKGGTKQPSELGIESYRWGHQINPKFLEGRTPPPVPLDSAENLEWYGEQLRRCIYGYEYKGMRISGDYYWFLNFTPFLVASKDAKGEVTSDFQIDFPYFSHQHDYIFKLLEEAHSLGKLFMMMGGRGYGKTYQALSVLAKSYYLKPESNNIVSASIAKHADEAFQKLKRMLLAIDKAHPTLALARLVDTKFMVKSGYEVNIDGVKREEGPMSVAQEVIYGDNPGIIRGWRPDTQLLEECLATGTKVLMGDKKLWKVEDIKVGDLGMTASFFKKRILHTTIGESMMYKIIPSIGNPYVVNENHKLRLVYYDEFGDKYFVNMKVSDFIKRDDQDYFYGVRIDLKEPEIHIEEVGKGTYHGFTLDADHPSDHLFVLGDGSVTHNCGDWSTGKGDLKKCLSASEGSWIVGGIAKCRVMLIGTGGSVSSDQAKDVFLNPDVNNILAVNDFIGQTGRKHCIFIPSHYLYGGAEWERTAVNNNDGAKESLDAKRKLKEADAEQYAKFIQEYPYTIEEVFRKTGTNIFHQRNIAKQWVDIQFKAEHIVTPEKGFLEWKRTHAGKIIGVEWVSNPTGNIEIVEHPYHGPNKDNIFPDLYVGGVDSIDQGQLDSTSNRARSSLAMLIKKRIVDGEYFKQTSNIYVAKYIGRSMDVRDDYEEVLKLTMYYSLMLNIEYTKIGIRQYFIERKQFHRLMKRPMIARASVSNGDNEFLNKMRDQSLIGTTTSENVINYGDGKIKEYTRDHCQNIFFIDLIEQLRDYQREDRTKYDLVVAMALCEIADEDMLGIPAKSTTAVTKDFSEFGYYKDDNGVKRFGVLPKSKKQVTEFITESKMGFRWVDMHGNARFDDNFDVLDVRDLKIKDND